MPIIPPDDIKPSEITDESLYRQRRRFIKGVGVVAAGAAAVGGAGLALLGLNGESDAASRMPESTAPSGDLSSEITDYQDATHYNNFYEFGTGKEDPARNAHTLITRPWSVTVDGECDRPGTYDLDDFLAPHALEDRIYRLRCVEAWSMVIPWQGIPLGDVLKRFKPNSSAKYVAFTTLLDPEQMPGQRRPVLEWPYREGLRMDEAMHPLTLLSTGMYGKTLPNQNGAPLRLVVPWKYGFKSIKSIVRIHFTERQPPTSWNMAASREYGFYSNVNPHVDHPRWSQKKERRIGEGLFSPKRETLMFNGYADQVASLYTGMDLKRYF